MCIYCTKLALFVMLLGDIISLKFIVFSNPFLNFLTQCRWVPSKLKDELEFFRCPCCKWTPIAISLCIIVPVQTCLLISNHTSEELLYVNLPRNSKLFQHNLLSVRWKQKKSKYHFREVMAVTLLLAIKLNVKAASLPTSTAFKISCCFSLRGNGAC